ncbi:DNA polymerase III subunit epsilon [Alphaproteobacteria bacterium]|nr:DNA polymerase III subunit epsilon [Alphaproteobacteria bacterium]
MREVVLDTETTGLNYKSGDRIIEVGCVELLNHVTTGKTLQFYCSVEKKIDVGAIKVHGLTNDFLNNHPSFEDQAQIFLNFLKDDTLIIHNSQFDLGFINNELKIIGRPELKNKIIDTVALARKTLNTRIANLDYLCKRFSIDLSNRNFHGALLDSQLLSEVYLELNGGKQMSMHLSQNIAPKGYFEEKKSSTKPTFINVIVTPKEIMEHKLLTKQIKNSLWEKFDY